MVKSSDSLVDLFFWGNFSSNRTKSFNIPKTVISYKETFKKARDQMGNKELPVILGKKEMGGILVEDLAEWGHLMTSGATGSGLHCFIEALITTLALYKAPEELKIHLIDLQEICLPHFEGLLHLDTPIAMNTHQSSETLNKLNETLKERIKKPNQKGPYHVLVIKELASLIECKDSREAMNLIEALLRKGHEYGIHVVIATHRQSKEVLKPEFMELIFQKISFRAVSEEASRVAIDSVGAEKLNSPGYLVITTPNGLLELKAPYIDYYQIVEMVDAQTINSV